jgi:hypothetical protein
VFRQFGSMLHVFVECCKLFHTQKNCMFFYVLTPYVAV